MACGGSSGTKASVLNLAETRLRSDPADRLLGAILAAEFFSNPTKLNRQTRELEHHVTHRKQTTATRSNRQKFQFCFNENLGSLTGFLEGLCVSLPKSATAAADRGSLSPVGARKHARLLRPACDRAAAPGTNAWQSSSTRKHGCGNRFPQFLTGTASQTESDVTATKQITGEFLTGARTALSRLAIQRVVRVHRDNTAGSQCCNFLQLAFLRSCGLYGVADKPRSQWRILNMRRVFAMFLAGLMLNPGMLGAAPPPAKSVKTATPIKHLVIIFQENVSFDHYFGTYPVATNPSGEPHFKAAAGTPTVNGLNNALLDKNPNLNPLNLAGATNPFRLGPAAAATADQDHDYTPEQQAFDGGLMDLFPLSTGTPGPPPGAPPIADTTGLAMAYYDGNTVTALWNYAQHYAMSDNSYDTNFGPSTPGALNLVSGQTNGVIENNNGSGSVVPDGNGGLTLNSDADPAGDVCSTSTGETVRMGGKNIGDLLNASGVSWGFFSGGFNLSIVNANGTTGCNRKTTSAITNMLKNDYIPHHQPFQYYTSTANFTHARPSSVKLIGQQGDGANHQYDVLDFFAAVEAGNFPDVSFLKAPGFQDGHAGYSDPIDEQKFIVDTINFLQGQPEWSSTAVIINYDDSDGWYDHQLGQIVNSSAVPKVDVLVDGTPSCGTGKTALPGNNPNTLHAQGRCGYGPRLPYMVISPWARHNFVDHTMTDQTSTIRFIEDNWLDGERIGNGSFDSIANSITQMFDFKQVNDNDLFILNDKTGEVEFSSSLF
jgi:phospholipase C